MTAPRITLDSEHPGRVIIESDGPARLTYGEAIEFALTLIEAARQPFVRGNPRVDPFPTPTLHRVEDCIFCENDPEQCHYSINCERARAENRALCEYHL